jgi:hypothetical protein
VPFSAIPIGDSSPSGRLFFSWLAIESVLVHCMLTEESLPEAMRPTRGIQLAPAPVGAVAYLKRRIKTQTVPPPKPLPCCSKALLGSIAFGVRARHDAVGPAWPVRTQVVAALTRGRGL